MDARVARIELRFGITPRPIPDDSGSNEEPEAQVEPMQENEGAEEEPDYQEDYYWFSF